MITVTYLDHSGFAITTPDVVLVFDYYKDPDRKLEHVLNDKSHVPVVFFVSHHHPDHFNTSIFELAQNRERTYVISNDVFSRLVPKEGISVAWMSAGDVIDGVKGVKEVRAFGSTDVGVSFAVTLNDGSVIFHAGDLNDWHWKDESTTAEARKAEEHFTTILNRIAEAVPEMKIAMFPVDARMGSGFARGASLFLSKIKVDNFFPMHFWGEPQKACDFQTYVPEGCATKCHCLDRIGQSVEIS